MATDTIVAVATPPGQGGIGVLRIAGGLAPGIGRGIAGPLPEPRRMAYRLFRDGQGDILDQGLVVFFPGPRSFTGDDLVELHGHGAPLVLDALLQRCLELGARLARPGEFSERAFLNGKLDLAQAEAIADLIESRTAAAARLAVRTLQGEFSKRIGELETHLMDLRVEVEGSLDFPEEEPGLPDPGLAERLQALEDAGKSSLLNALAGDAVAIVTTVPGTTRDILQTTIQLQGLPVRILDTAGLREAADAIEQEGVRRARQAIAAADRLVWVFDGAADPDNADFTAAALPAALPLILIRNKIDLTGAAPGLRQTPQGPELSVSAARGDGLDELRRQLLTGVGFTGVEEGEFLARRRHLDALARAGTHLERIRAGGGVALPAELLAEELRLAHACLGEITGVVVADDLLGEIFSRFCIGK